MVDVTIEVMEKNLQNKWSKNMIKEKSNKCL